VAEKDMREYYELSERFIALANEMTAEGKDGQAVNAALMSASGVYATYIAAGNGGGLTASGIKQVTSVYKENLKNIQKMKRESLAQTGG
jgi:hypothetical protein